MIQQQRRLGAGLFLLAALLVSAVLAVSLGPVSLTLEQLYQALLTVLKGGDSSEQVILWHIRIPRLLLGLLVGSGLAVCGAVMQGLFRNPLADPGLIGVSSGASLGAALSIVLGGQLMLAAEWQRWLTPFSAFIFGAAVTLLVYKLASSRGRTEVATLLLAGVAIQAVAGAGIGLLTYLADDTQLRDLTFWSMGSLGGAQWNTVAVTAVLSLPTLLVLLRLSRGLNALLLGEAEAAHIGIQVERLKILAITFSALLVGVSVAAAGMIGFVGLVTPHLIRLSLGSDHRFLLPASAILGGVLLVCADVLARTLISPAELPIGILTALIGGPFFIYLLLQQRARVML